MPGALPNKQPWTEWDFQLRTSANRVPYVAGVAKFGYNSSIGATVEDVWSQGGVLSFLSAAETMDIVSTDAADTAAGTGARTINVFGLDGNYMPISENVTLNGTTPVTTTNAFMRINRMRLDTTGSGNVNAGSITATASTASTVQGNMNVGLGTTFKTQYTVPAGFYAFIRGVNYGTLNNDQCQVTLQVKEFGCGWITRDLINFVETFVDQDFDVPLRVGPKADIRIQGQRISGSGSVSVSARYRMDLVREQYVNTNSIVVDET